PEAAGRVSKLDPLTREIIALAVSATNGCEYCVNSHTAALRKLGMDVETLGEGMAVVRLFNSTNAIADGYRIEPDILPPQEGGAVTCPFGHWFECPNWVGEVIRKLPLLAHQRRGSRGDPGLRVASLLDQFVGELERGVDEVRNHRLVEEHALAVH